MTKILAARKKLQATEDLSMQTESFTKVHYFISIFELNKSIELPSFNITMSSKVEGEKQITNDHPRMKKGVHSCKPY